MEPAEIAKKLTPARRKMLELARLNTQTISNYGPAVWLSQAGLIRQVSKSFGSVQWYITEEGLAVLSEVKKAAKK